MGKKFLLLALVAAAAYWMWSCCSCCNPKQPPQMDLEEWWGPEELKEKHDTSIKPFEIHFRKDIVAELRDLLGKRRKFTPPLEGIAFEYGFNTVYLEEVVKFWENSYNFTERQDYLNKFPHFKTKIQGLDIHFIHVKPSSENNIEVIPLLLLHGWPGSVREFYEIIPMLTAKREGSSFVFEVIVPSLPGYGFSSGTVKPGLATPQVAVIMRNLMHRLGFKKYFIQGGDWGAVTCADLATLFPNEVLGLHTNMANTLSTKAFLKTVIGSFFPSLVVEEHLANRMYPMSKTFSFMLEETAYAHIQATKPDTVGVALANSPVGLAAYILEKFSTWTNQEFKKLPDGGLTKKFHLEDLLDNVMIYWITNSITTSMRLYAEYFSEKNRAMDFDSIPTTVPTWALQAKHELSYQPPNLLKYKYINLIDVTVLDDGGHFIAFELPHVVADDIFKAVSAFKDWHKKRKDSTEKSEF